MKRHNFHCFVSAFLLGIFLLSLAENRKAIRQVKTAQQQTVQAITILRQVEEQRNQAFAAVIHWRDLWEQEREQNLTNARVHKRVFGPLAFEPVTDSGIQTSLK